MRTVEFKDWYGVKKYDMEIIEQYMDDEIRERLHGELAPCADQVFFDRYMEEDPEFMERFSMDLYPISEEE